MKSRIFNLKNRHALRRADGFTLVELLMVVAIMVLILKLTLPSLKGLMGSKPHSMARSQLIGDLNSARTMALRNGVPVYVAFMPLLSEVGRHAGDVDNYLEGEGNSMLGEQSTSYAIYAEYLPGDQPGEPSKRWLTDWKRLPSGFYFAGEDLTNIWHSADASGGNRLAFSTMKNGHLKKDGMVTRLMYLPYIMYNSRGELSARGNPGEVRVGDFYLKLTEGGVFQPERLPSGKYHLGSAGREDSAVATNKTRVWLHINGITGRAGVLEEEPDKPRLYSLRVYTLSSDPRIVAETVDQWLSANAVGKMAHDRRWAQPSMWGNKDDRGKYIFIGNPNKIRPVAIGGIPRVKLMGLIAYLQRVDPGIEVRYHRN
jgi:prepilin-type N-terminal cleavage/methylation domain-containing protein